MDPENSGAQFEKDVDQLFDVDEDEEDEEDAEEEEEEEEGCSGRE